MPKKKNFSAERMKKMEKKQEFVYGAVLKVERENTLDDIQKSFEAMKDIGFNTVVVWPAVYWWEEKGPGYPYETGKQLLRIAEEAGIGIVMELAGQITALEYMPDPLCKEEYFCEDRKGCRELGTVSYGYLNFNHPEVQALIEQQYTEIAEAYGSFPALRGYDIWNETQFASFDRYTLEKFRVWLKEKYGTLDALNDAWDRAYEKWEQVQFTAWMWASVMAVVDYHQFQKANIGMILKYMRKAIERADSSHEILADNIHSTVTMDAYYERPSDDWGVAAEVDRYGISFYPKFFTKHTPAVRRHQVMAGAHSAAKDGVFSISEMQTHHASMFNPEGSVSPEELWQWCWEAVAHGAKGLIYWKWDPFRKGVQTGGRGLLDCSGRETMRAKTARRVSEILVKEPLLTTAAPEPESAAILYDSLNHDFTKAYTIGFRGTGIGAPDSIYLDSIAGLYRILWKKNIPVKFVTPGQVCAGGLKQFRAVFLTTQVTMDAPLAQALSEYVEDGGTLVCDGKFAEVDAQGLLYRQIPGAGLSKDFGFELLDFEEGNLEFDADGLQVTGGHDRRQILEESLAAEVEGRFADGKPAVLKASYGAGKLYYISTFLWFACQKGGGEGAAELLDRLLEGCGLQTVFCEEPEVSCLRLNGEGGSLLFALNYDKKEKNIKFSVNLEPQVYEAFIAQEEKQAGTGTEGQRVNPVAAFVQEIFEDREVEWNCENGRLHFSYPMAPGGTAIFKFSAKQPVKI